MHRCAPRRSRDCDRGASSRRRRSLNPTASPIRIGPASRSRRRLFRSPPIWAGPELDLNSQSWRDESDVADLEGANGAAARSHRRRGDGDRGFQGEGRPRRETPSFCAPSPRRSTDLSQQRSQIIDGLDRFGRRQNALADRIRAENEAVKSRRTRTTDAQAPPGAGAQGSCYGTFASSTIAARPLTYVCEAPTLIEQRIGEIARAVQSAL